MNRARLLMVPVVLLGLSGWSVVLANDDNEGKVKIEREVKTESTDHGSKTKMETEVEREGQAPISSDQMNRQQERMNAQQDRGQSEQMRSARQPQWYAGEFADQRPLATQPAWTQMRTSGGMMDRDFGASDRGLSRRDFDRFIGGAEQSGAGFRTGPEFYWQGPAGGSMIYGYQGTEPEATSTAGPAGGGVGTAIMNQSSEPGPHLWRHAENVVDDNLIQTQDQFDVPLDYYTKEWKISEPPLQVHGNFLTIYDNAATEGYFTPWFGSPVLWAPNEMVPVPMPATNNQTYMFDKHQLATYFTTWRDGPKTDTPGTYSLNAVPTVNSGVARSSIGGSEVYGYMEAAPSGAPPVRDGALHVGNRTLYWDDQDVISSPGPISLGRGNEGVYGYVSPEDETFFNTGPSAAQGNLLMNVPKSTGVDIFGVPGEGAHRSGSIYGYVSPEESSTRETTHWWSLHRSDSDRGVYGYASPEESGTTTEHKTHWWNLHTSRDHDRVYGYAGPEETTTEHKTHWWSLHKSGDDDHADRETKVTERREVKVEKDSDHMDNNYEHHHSND